MTDALIILKATEEIENKNLGVTEQFLDIHQIVYDGSKPKAIAATSLSSELNSVTGLNSHKLVTLKIGIE